MFVCEECHGPSHKTFRSYGRCEVCGKTKPCLEVSNYDRKLGNKEEGPQ